LEENFYLDVEFGESLLEYMDTVLLLEESVDIKNTHIVFLKSKFDVEEMLITLENDKIDLI
jgi:hypothetical protein